MKLTDLKVGDKARILGFEAKYPNYRSKLLAMGLIPGTEFTLTRVAPLGDPIQILVRGFSLIIRKNEAEILKIEKVFI